MWRLSILCCLLLQSAPEDSAVDSIAASGCCVQLADKPDARLRQQVYVAPAGPPTLSFRQFEGQKQQRFSHSDLLLDDAGH